MTWREMNRAVLWLEVRVRFFERRQVIGRKDWELTAHWKDGGKTVFRKWADVRTFLELLAEQEKQVELQRRKANGQA